MTPASYTITGSGPSSATFTQTITGTSTTVASLAFGSWTVTINAYNSDTTPTLIGSGSATVTVNTGETTTASITVTPITGTGTLDLSASWTSSLVSNPSISASLTPYAGTAKTLTFSTPTVTSGTATSTSATTGLATGYGVLALSLLDNTTSEAGAVEVVRIVNGQTTSGTYTLNPNQAGGSIQVNFSQNMENPLNVTISGASSSTLAAGASENLTASASGDTSGGSTIAYVWYVNTTIVQNGGASYTFTAPATNTYVSDPVYYNITAVAFNSNGTQGGSTTVQQTVTY
jgi:hypothetical protein